MALNSAFFDAVRVSLFGGKLTQGQVATLGAIDDAWQRYGDKLGYASLRLAYVLATAYREAGAALQPNTESLNYSVDALLNNFSRQRISAADSKRLGRTDGRAADQQAIANLIYGGAWGRENLGNTQPGDGWRFRGRGLAHLTGRRNYEYWSKRLGIDLLGRPELAADLKIAARILVEGMVIGAFTGRKLQDYINSDQCDFVGARSIVNGTDKAALIAGYAEKFSSALAGGAALSPPPNSSPQAPPEGQPTTPPRAPRWVVAIVFVVVAAVVGIAITTGAFNAG